MTIHKQMREQLIPQTDSIEELARFWDSHDLTDFEDELDEVAEPVFEREVVVSVRLPVEEADVVKKIAESRGMAWAELIREWVIERAHAC